MMNAYGKNLAAVRYSILEALRKGDIETAERWSKANGHVAGVDIQKWKEDNQGKA